MTDKRRPVLEAVDDWAADGGAPGQEGIWSQGVQVEVRWVVVLPG